MVIVEAARGVTGGVDTHLDVHVAAALDSFGGVLGTESFAASSPGYAALLTWLEHFGTVGRVGIEGTGSYGTGLTRSFVDTMSTSSRWTAPTAKSAGDRASPIHSTRLRRPVRPSAGGRRRSQRKRPATSRRSGCSSSGRFRLDRGGDRQANSALWRITMVRIAHDPRTTSYYERKVKEGRSKRDVIRILKRYVAREIYHYLPRG